MIFTAVGYDTFNNVNNTGITFSFNGSINSTGYFNSTANGIYSVSASDAGTGVSNTTSILILPDVVTSIQLTPVAASIAAGATQQYSSIGFDQWGNLNTSAAFAYSSNASVGVDASGLFTNTTTGVYSVTSSVGAASNTTSISIYSNVPASAYLSVSNSTPIVGNNVTATAFNVTDAYGNLVNDSNTLSFSMDVGSSALITPSNTTLSGVTQAQVYSTKREATTITVSYAGTA